MRVGAVAKKTSREISEEATSVIQAVRLLSVPLYCTSYKLEDAVSPVIKWERLTPYLWNYYKSHY